MGRKLNRMVKRQENHESGSMMTRADLNRFSEKISKFTTNMILICVALVLHREFGFGKVRIMRLIDGVEKLAGDINSGAATIDDYKKQAEEEAKVSIDL